MERNENKGNMFITFCNMQCNDLVSTQIKRIVSYMLLNVFKLPNIFWRLNWTITISKINLKDVIVKLLLYI